jgi:hypothetical protein
MYFLQTAYAVKWAIIAAIFLIFSLYFVGGYLHAQRRMKRGLPPLAYHRVRTGYAIIEIFPRPGNAVQVC